MERTSNTAKIKFRKQGGGVFRLSSGKIIKPGQVFEATWDQIPKAFRDTIVPVDKNQKPTGKLPLPKVEVPEYSVKLRSPGYYDVIDGEGKVINEKALRKEAAEELIESLKV